jgi:hypothetical protein
MYNDLSSRQLLSSPRCIYETDSKWAEFLQEVMSQRQLCGRRGGQDEF